jgi:tRNA(adenine34) deaminase
MTHGELMDIALQRARAARALEEIPIGAALAGPDGELLAADHNRRHVDGDPTAHAEMLVLRNAARRRGDWRLAGCTLAVTLEPCCMCAGAIVLARIETLVYGAEDPKAGAVRSLYRLCDDDRLNHRVRIVPGIRAEDCGQLLRSFFAEQRARGKK